MSGAKEWQPIATAPRDGTAILAAMSLDQSDGWYVIEWADAEKGIRKEAGPGVGWHHAWDGYFFGQHEQPLYWMHQPTHPEEKGEAA
jgi:hypothetical protein